MEKSKRLIAKLIFLCSLFVLVFSVDPVPVKPLRHRIDLDKPLEEQYAKIYPQYKQALVEYIDFFYQNPLIKKYSGYGRYLSLFQSSEWHEEIKMYARITGLDEDFFILNSLSYNLYCTSIIVRNKNNEVFMGRNLDYFGSNKLSKIALEYEYYLNDEPIAIAATMFGSTGILNAVRNGKFVVSLNMRDRLHKSDWTNILRFALGYPDPLSNLRKVVLNSKDYDEALYNLQNTKINSAGYYTIAGVKPNEGAVIARTYSGVHLIDTLNDNTWFLVQTNYDRNLIDPQTDYRRVPAEEKINNLGKNITVNELFDVVMSKKPNLLKKTIWTTMQSANSTLFNTVIWVQPNSTVN